VLPETCHEEGANLMFDDSLFGEVDLVECRGCSKNDPAAHTGRYARIKDWQTNKTIRFVDMLKEQESTTKTKAKKE
jgi:hypothetical protein